MSDEPQQGSTVDYCEKWPDEGHYWSTTSHAVAREGEPRLHTRTCVGCQYLDVSEVQDQLRGLRQELDEARAERDAATTLRSAFTELEFALREEQHARKINEYGLLGKLRDAEAERDRMRPVVEAAEAWRRSVPAFEGPHERPLADAVDAYRSSTPDAEPAPGVPVDTEEESRG